MPSHQELVDALSRYPAALELRAAASPRSAKLVELDQWYRGTLFGAMQERSSPKAGDKGTPGQRIHHDELDRLMDWKLARGKWRPRLQSLVAGNKPSDLSAAVGTAVDAHASGDIQAALDALCKLSGVGPASASAILAAWDPQKQPFMSDEAMDGAAAYDKGDAGGSKKREYTVKAWRAYTDEMQRRQATEGWESMEDLEKALWSWAVHRRYGESKESAHATPAEVNSADSSKSAKGRKRAVEPAEPAQKKHKAR